MVEIARAACRPIQRTAWTHFAGLMSAGNFQLELPLEVRGVTIDEASAKWPGSPKAARPREALPGPRLSDAHRNGAADGLSAGTVGRQSVGGVGERGNRDAAVHGQASAAAGPPPVITTEVAFWVCQESVTGSLE